MDMIIPFLPKARVTHLWPFLYMWMTSSSLESLFHSTSLKQVINSIFKIRDLGFLKYFLGMEIARSSSGFFMSQRKYALQLLEDSAFLACKPDSTHMDHRLRLSSTDGEPLSDHTQYLHIIGRLLYFTLSRPDIAFAIHKLSRYVSQPRLPHLQAVQHLRYLKGNPGQGMFFPASSTHQLKAFSDAD